MFWDLGRKSAKPSSREIELYLQDLSPNEPVCIVGASSRDVVARAVATDLTVQVYDFSQRMVADLKSELGPHKNLSIDVHDALEEPSVGEHNRFKVVLADRLINRFSKQEAARFFNQMAKILMPEGELRLMIKIGLYEIDKALIREGLRRGTVGQFFNESTHTINFSAASDELEAAVVPHGEIPRDVLIAWYKGRGAESRFEVEDVIQMAEGEPSLRFIRCEPAPDAPATYLFIFGKKR
jgi:hypothetical protein